MSAKPQTALITGATSGIGLELAKLFARDGYSLVLVARDRNDLSTVSAEIEQEHNVPVLTIPADLSKPESVKKITNILAKQKLQPDVLINNAGYGLLDSFTESDETAQQNMMRVNMDAVVRLTRALLPGMVKRKRGRILNVASIAAYLPGPNMAVYYASKAFVSSFSGALADELRSTGITVTALCPGPTRTGFEFRASVTGTPLFRNAASAESVAKAGYRGLLKGKRVVIPGFVNKLFVLGTRLVPSRLAARFAHRSQR